MIFVKRVIKVHLAHKVFQVKEEKLATQEDLEMMEHQEKKEIVVMMVQKAILVCLVYQVFAFQ